MHGLPTAVNRVKYCARVERETNERAMPNESERNSRGTTVVRWDV